MSRGLRVDPVKQASVIAQAEINITQDKIAELNGLSRPTVAKILTEWKEKEKIGEDDFLPYIGIFKKRLAESCFNNAANLINLSHDDIYVKSSPYQRIGMAGIMVDKGLLLLGQATQIVAYEDVDEDKRARYLRLLQERMRTIDVTPVSPQIAPTSPIVVPQDTPEPTPSPKQVESQPDKPMPIDSPTEAQWQRLQANQCKTAKPKRAKR